MGTFGGSVANNDPAACYPSALLALGATVNTDKRSIKADGKLQAVFGKESATMFELAGIIGKHLS